MSQVPTGQLSLQPPHLLPLQVEAVIQEVWGDVLSLKPASISVTADFFSEGGSSLKAGIVQAQLRDRLRVPALGGIALMQESRELRKCGCRWERRR